MRNLRSVVNCHNSLFSYCKTRVFARRLKDIKKWFSTTSYTLSNNDPQFDLSKFPPERIRNFSIVAHVDHGKSTLADRILEITGVISKSSENKQVLDKLQVERERGITVKAQTASLFYKHNGQDYLLNLIDTPGHVDFSYEVSRSLAACQGVILLVDAAQGVQAQTVSNYFLATGADLAVIPVLNKIDLKNANPHEVSLQMEKVFNMNPIDILKLSAKEGVGVDELLHAIVDRLPSPKCDLDQPVSALLFDSWYDQYRGVICLVAVLNGCLNKGDKVKSIHSGQTYEVSDIGIMHPNEYPTEALYAGQVGYLVTGMRNRKDAQIGDTFCHVNSNVKQFPGFKPAMPMVFAGVYPVDMSQYVTLRNAIEKLTLSDSSVAIHPDSCIALGQGWRLGFLGFLHMDVFKLRLEQEYDTSIIITTPSVPYKAVLKGQELKEVEILNPLELPGPSQVEEYLEPFVLGTVIFPYEYMGKMITLCQNRRGEQDDVVFIDENRVMMKYLFPLSEIIIDFYDELKSLSSGYASFDYEEYGYLQTDIHKMDVLINGKAVDALSCIVHKDKALSKAKHLCINLRDVIPRQLFEVVIQASVRGKIIARESIRPLRKDVTAKCYGGDMSRKRKLLDRQKEGKRKMKRIGKVDLPHEAFLTLMKR